MRRDTPLVIISVCIIGLILIGEAYIYTFNADSAYRADASVSADGVHYSAYSGISNRYDVVVTDNGSLPPVSEYYVYYDVDYVSAAKETNHPIGGKELNQEYYVSQLVHQLENRGISPKIINASEFAEMLNSGNEKSKAVIVVSGVLPETVYAGDTFNAILPWIDAGGRLYWAGNLLGAYYSTADKIIPVQGNYELSFFGVECLNKNTDLNKSYTPVSSNDYRDRLCLTNNSVRYAVNVSALFSASVPCLELGYTEEGYASAALVKCGSGQICLLGGDYSNYQRADLVQILASGLTYQSDLVGYAKGIVTRNTVSDTINTPIDSSRHYSVYVYFGGYYPEYGRCYDFRGTAPL